MADRVQYFVSSEFSAPICELYFCRHCLKLKSSSCVSHEVDSLYCPNCLENMPSGEAKLKRNRCASCFDCPSCHHTLSTRATTLAASTGETDPEAQAAPRKAFYLACGFCRWTSRDVAIKDQTVSSGGWQDQENTSSKRIAVLLDYYRQLAMKEKLDKEKKKYSRRRSYLQLSDKYGLGHVARRSNSLMGGLSKDVDNVKIHDVEPSVASDDVENLPDDLYTKPLVLAQVTNITQRLANPEFQQASADGLYPIHKHLLIKRSLRCKECEHNLSKPEYNPSSIKFKIQMVAVHHIPEIRIMSIPNLKLNQPSQVILTLFNPLDFVVRATLLPLTSKSDTAKLAQVELPCSELVLSRCDDAVEFDDSGFDSNENIEDDASVIVFRKANKIGFFITVMPLHENEDVKVMFCLRHNYRTMTTALPTDATAAENVSLEHTICINFGQLTSD